MNGQLITVMFIASFGLAACDQAPDKGEVAEGSGVAEEASTEIHQGYSETASLYEVDGVVVSNDNPEAYLWNPRGKTDEQIAARSQFLADAYDVKRTEAQLKRAAQARDKYADAIVINSLLPAAVGIIGNTAGDLQRGLERNQDAGMTLVSATVYAFPGDGDAANAIGRIDASTPVVDEMGLVLAKSVSDIRRAKAEGKMAVMFNVQGSDFVVEDMGLLAAAKKKGLNVANFVYNNDNELAGGGTRQEHGVTDLGKEFIAAANANKIIVDCSHSSNQTCIDAASYTTKPNVASHSNAAALFDLGRNMSDEAIEAVGSTGGAVCNTGVGLFLNAKGDASPEEYVEHVVYTAKLIGKDKTCYSTDYMPAAGKMFAANVANVDVYPPEKGFGAPASNIAAEHIWDVVALLEDNYGWNEQEIRGFLGENLMRVYAANWE
jgi:microsomal dipeptidase-like Zn-dependent dipeptidase